jgi:hypothetical protein
MLTERHEAQIATLRSDADETVASARVEGEQRLGAGLEDQAEHLAVVHRAELATALAEARAGIAETEARHRAELAQLEATAAGARELAEARLEENRETGGSDRGSEGQAHPRRRLTALPGVEIRRPRPGMSRHRAATSSGCHRW